MTGLYIGLHIYFNFHSEANVEQIIAIVTKHSVSCLIATGFHLGVPSYQIIFF